MVLPVNGSTHLIPAYYSFINPERTKGWVGWPVADGLPTLVVTHQLQVERRTGKVCRPETDVLPLCHATNQVMYKVMWSNNNYSNNLMIELVARHSGRTSVSGRWTFPVLRSTCSWWVTTNVGKPSTIGQPTQPVILSGSIKWLVRWNQMCAAVYR